MAGEKRRRVALPKDPRRAAAWTFARGRRVAGLVAAAGGGPVRHAELVEQLMTFGVSRGLAESAVRRAHADGDIELLVQLPRDEDPEASGLDALADRMRAETAEIEAARRDAERGDDAA